MKIALIHGQNHKGSTYNIARMVADRIGGNIDEFFLPSDFGEMCNGCFACCEKGMEFCPHHTQISRIFESMLSADIIIIGSPTYVLEMSGALKSFFDHLFCKWLSHRPQQAMFSKVAVAVSSCAGAGVGGVTKSIARQLFYMGAPKVFRLPVRVAASRWNEVINKDKIHVRAEKIARLAATKAGKTRPGLKLRVMFSIMRLMQKNNNWAPLDNKYWKDMGWLGKKRPWKAD